MEDCLKEFMRKLAVWFTKTFKPIMTHDELEPIMVTLGFIGLEPVTSATGISWKSYKYTAAGCRTKSVSAAAAPPLPRLPYPRIDGLHIYTYRAFLDSVNFYLEKFDISDLFHIRGLPLYRNQDRNRKWRLMDEEGGHFVYREGTLDPLNSYNSQKNCPSKKRDKRNNSTINDEESDNHRNMNEEKIDEDNLRIVSLKDIIT